MVDLSDVCYQKIHSDGTNEYWYGVYGDFNLIINRTDNTFNATKLCHDGGKEFSNWKRNKQSEKLVSYLLSQGKDNMKTIDDVYKLRKGGSGIRHTLNGTYVPKELIVHIACWISPNFSVKVEEIVSNCCERIKKYQSSLENMNLQLEKNESEMKKMKSTVNHLNSQVTEYQKVHEDITPKTVNKGKLHVFALIDKKDGNVRFPYYAMRVQRISYTTELNRLRSKYPNLHVVKYVSYNPNSINLYNRIKETIDYIDFSYNDLGILNGYTLNNLITDIDRVHNTKFSQIGQTHSQ